MCSDRSDYNNDSEKPLPPRDRAQRARQEGPVRGAADVASEPPTCSIRTIGRRREVSFLRERRPSPLLLLTPPARGGVTDAPSGVGQPSSQVRPAKGSRGSRSERDPAENGAAHHLYSCAGRDMRSCFRVFVPSGSPDPPDTPAPSCESVLCLSAPRTVCGTGECVLPLGKNVNVNEQSARKHMRITIHARMLLVLLLLDDHIRRRVYELLYE